MDPQSRSLQSPSHMVNLSQAIDTLSEYIEQVYMQKEREIRSTYKKRMLSEALKFISQELMDTNISRSLIPFKHLDLDDLFELVCDEDEPKRYSLSESKIDMQQLLELAKEHFACNQEHAPSKQNTTGSGNEPGLAKQPSKSKKTSTTLSNTEAAKELSDKRWGAVREIKDYVKKYVMAEVTKPSCTCLPKHVQQHVLELESSDGMMLIDTNVLSENATFKYIKQLFAENLVNRTQNGRTPKNTCPIHSAKKRPSR